MKKLAIEQFHDCKLPDRKAVIKRESLDQIGQLGCTSRAPYSSIERCRSDIDVPLRKKKFAEVGGTWSDIWSYSASDAMKARHWAIMTSRISHAKDAFSQCIDANPLIRSGTPVVKDTRVPVSAIFANLAADMSVSDIADDLGLPQETLVAIVQCVATLFDGLANEYDPARRMHKLEAIKESMRAGREDLGPSVSATIERKEHQRS